MRKKMSKEDIKRGLKDADEKFDLLYNITTGAIDMFQVPNMTGYSVSMAVIEGILAEGQKHADRDTMVMLCDLMIECAQKYHPKATKPTKETSASAVEACGKIWGMSRDEALEWLGSDAGAYMRMGGEHRWMSGAAIKSLLEKVAK